MCHYVKVKHEHHDVGLAMEKSDIQVVFQHLIPFSSVFVQERFKLTMPILDAKLLNRLPEGD